MRPCQCERFAVWSLFSSPTRSNTHRPFKFFQSIKNSFGARKTLFYLFLCVFQFFLRVFSTETLEFFLCSLSQLGFSFLLFEKELWVFGKREREKQGLQTRIRAMMSTKQAKAYFDCVSKWSHWFSPCQYFPCPLCYRLFANDLHSRNLLIVLFDSMTAAKQPLFLYPHPFLF